MDINHEENGCNSNAAVANSTNSPQTQNLGQHDLNESRLVLEHNNNTQGKTDEEILLCKLQICTT